MKNKSSIFSKICTILIFLVIPLIFTAFWVGFILVKGFSTSTIYDDVLGNSVIYINAKKNNESGIFNEIRAINLTETVAYVDMWRSHWCTYYNDREFFFTPRINEVLQRIRSVGVRVVHISLSVDHDLPMVKQRRAGFKAIEKGNLSVLERFHARAARYHADYIPGFSDECVYPGLERYGPTRDNRFTQSIAIAQDDVFVSNFKESAMSFVGLGAKTVIVMGQHTNMCLMAVFLYCREVNLDLIIIRDLVDSCWLYENQKNHVNTHTKGNEAVNSYFEKEFGSSILSYDLIRALKNLKSKKYLPKYQMFTKSAFLFKHI